jgi:hypothetical protein
MRTPIKDYSKQQPPVRPLTPEEQPHLHNIAARIKSGEFRIGLIEMYVAVIKTFIYKKLKRILYPTPREVMLLGEYVFRKKLKERNRKRYVRPGHKT